jgi:REP element-mobilizing transposase RayT
VHRYEHWYLDNQVYFITARCRDRFPAFSTEAAKNIVWDRFQHWTDTYGFTPWVTSLLDNHYHMLGYLRPGENLGPMMQRLHGSVAKLVNDLLPERRQPFWREKAIVIISTAVSETKNNAAARTGTRLRKRCATVS